ncbi:MAG: DUF6370 family protein [Phycisphaerae bacterium]
MIRVLMAGLVTLAVMVGGCAENRADRAVTHADDPGGLTLHGQAGCATCIFDMKGVTGCKLAVKFDDRAYLVVGSAIDDHGDAHADDGLCNAARPAEFEGTVVGDKFVATRFTLVPERDD